MIDSIRCTHCGTVLPITVHYHAPDKDGYSEGGYFVGSVCPHDGFATRITVYYPSKELAELALVVDEVLQAVAAK